MLLRSFETLRDGQGDDHRHIQSVTEVLAELDNGQARSEETGEACNLLSEHAIDKVVDAAL